MFIVKAGFIQPDKKAFKMERTKATKYSLERSVSILANTHQGSGSIISPFGHILTNAHVATTNLLTVRFSDGRGEYVARRMVSVAKTGSFFWPHYYNSMDIAILQLGYQDQTEKTRLKTSLCVDMLASTNTVTNAADVSNTCIVDPEDLPLWRINFKQESCGDASRSTGEECDDGNNVDGDGCSNDCLVEKDFSWPHYSLAAAEDTILVGDKVLVLGNALAGGMRVSSGIVTRKNNFYIPVRNNPGYGYAVSWETDAIINGGNSGGSVVLKRTGELIGIPTWASTSESRYVFQPIRSFLNFLNRTCEALEMENLPIEGLPYPSLPIEYEQTPPYTLARAKSARHADLVQEVSETVDTVVDQAEILIGADIFPDLGICNITETLGFSHTLLVANDVITHIDNNLVSDRFEIEKLLSKKYHINDTVLVQFIRSGVINTRNVTLEGQYLPVFWKHQRITPLPPTLAFWFWLFLLFWLLPVFLCHNECFCWTFYDMCCCCCGFSRICCGFTCYPNKDILFMVEYQKMQAEIKKLKNECRANRVDIMAITPPGTRMAIRTPLPGMEDVIEPPSYSEQAAKLTRFSRWCSFLWFVIIFCFFCFWGAYNGATKNQIETIDL
jgi:cysteine-rich repeat protein